MKFRALAFVLVLIAALPAAAQTLNRAGRGEPGSLDPHKANSQYEQALVLDLFEGLLAFDADGQPAPGLADSWAVAPDNRRYVFNLRPGLVWSDGSPITPEQIVASFRRLLDPKTAAPAAAQMYVIKNARAVNTGKMDPAALGVTAAAGTIAIELEAPAAYLPSLLAAAFAVVVPPQAFQNPDSWTRPGVMVSNGAFTLAEWQPQSHITLAKNTSYRDAPNVRLARVVYHPAGDTTAALARYKAGDFQMVMEFPSAQTDQLIKEMKGEAKLTPALLTYYLALNMRDAKLEDRRVRRALSLAVDRDTLVSKVVRGGALPANSFVPPAAANYTPPVLDLDAAPYEDRLRESQRLLAEAGYSAANPLRLTYSHSANQELRRIAVVIAAMWKRAGVELSLLNTEGRVHFSNLRQGVFEVAFVAWLADFNDAANFLSVLESASSASNYAKYDNPSYDGFLRRAAQTSNLSERAKVLKDAEALMLSDQPIIPLYYGATRNLVSNKVSGWRGNATDVHLSRYLSLVP